MITFILRPTVLGLGPRFSRVALVAASLSLAACGSDTGDEPGETVDLEELELLEGLDAPVLLSEAELDAMFPLLEEMPPAEDEDEGDDPAAAHDPTQGGMLEARLAAYVPTANGDLYFTIQPHATVPAAFVEATRRGVLFGMDNFDSLFPGFSLYAAAAEAPFDVVFFDSPAAGTAFRASVTACPSGGAGGWAACRPRVNIPYDGGKAIRAGTFVHEIGHVGHGYYTRSKRFIDAGGVVMGSFRHSEFRWQREGSAQLIGARSPDWSAYDRLGSGRCAFEVLQRGVIAWKDLTPVGGESFLPYQTSLLLDSVTWHRFANSPTWLLDWWVASPDARNPARPESAARALLRRMSPRADTVDVAGANTMIVSAGLDLFVRGRNPWTTRTLSKDCFSVVGAAFAGATPGSAAISVPAIAFDGLRIPIAAGALDTAKSLRFTLVADRPANVRATILGAQLDLWIGCIAGLEASALGTNAPRKACSDSYALGIGTLALANNHQRTLKVTDAVKNRLATGEILAVVYHVLTPGSPLTPVTATLTVDIPPAQALTINLVNRTSAPDHVRFHETGTSPFTGVRVDAGASGTLQLMVEPGQDVAITVSKPSDDGPTPAASTTCKVSDAPTNPTVTYSGSLVCSGF